MGIADSILAGISDFSQGLSELTNGLPQSYCVLNTTDSPTTLVSNNGSLASVIELGGSIVMVGSDSYRDIISTISDSLQPFMVDNAHQLQIVFDYDPSQAGVAINESLAPTFSTAELLHLDLKGFLRDWSDSVSSYCSRERCYIVLWTLPDALSSVSKKADRKNMQKSFQNSIQGEAIQKTGWVPTYLHEVHDGYLSSVKTALSDLELIHKVMDNHETLHGIRSMLFPSLTGNHWRAALPGDPIPKTAPEPLAKKGDQSPVGYPDIGEQLFPDATEDTGSLIVIDDRYHAPLLMTLPPQTPKPFNTLFRSLIAKDDLPWRISILIDSGGSVTFKSVLSSILSFASSDNKKINKAIQEMERNGLNGETNVRFKMAIDTWASSYEEAINNRSDLSGAIQAWGSSDVTALSGDPLLGVSATLPAFMLSNPAPGAMPPLEQALNLMPLTRSSSPWETGSIPLRTPDGKLMPYAQMSDLQNAWVDIGIAPMGFGKSVWLNTQNLAFCLQASLGSLPYLSIIDIGPSSKGLISLLKSALPPDEAYLAEYHRLRMEREYAINPFDLPLCTFKPTPSHESFLVNFVTLLCTPLGADAPPDSISGLARAAIKAAYQEFEPKNNPKQWVAGIDPDVDVCVDSLGLHTQGLTWCTIADALFEQGDYHNGSRAQRYAVPLLSDVATMARRDLVSGIYSGEADNKESIVNYFWRSCIDAISAYSILASPTAFDIGDAKVVALDLDEVAPRGGPEADRQSGVMYMLARHVVGSRFFRMPADVKAIPEKYREYHLSEIKKIREQPKRLSYDEFHRVSRNSSVSKQIVSDIETAVRESRKWLLSIGLYSQSLSDFPDVLVDLSSAFFVMGVGNEKEARKIVDLFGLSKPSIAAISKLRKPNRAGATMLAYFKTSKGNSEQLLTNTLGPQGMWAFSTTTEDTAVRDLLYSQIGVTDTLKRLGDRYPGGVKAPLASLIREKASLGEKPPHGAVEWVEALGLAS